METLREGITEADVAAELGKVMLENGADVYGYYLTTDWQPIRWPLINRDRMLARGDLVHSDLWDAVDGYIFIIFQESKQTVPENVVPSS